MEASPNSTVESVMSEEMWLGIYCGGILIYHDRFQDQDGMFPFIPYFADRKKSGEPFGPVRNLVPLNKEIDKRRSKALHLMSNNQAILEQNAVEDIGAFNMEKARADGTMVVRKLEGDTNYQESGYGPVADVHARREQAGLQYGVRR